MFSQRNNPYCDLLQKLYDKYRILILFIKHFANQIYIFNFMAKFRQKKTRTQKRSPRLQIKSKSQLTIHKLQLFLSFNSNLVKNKLIILYTFGGHTGQVWTLTIRVRQLKYI